MWTRSGCPLTSTCPLSLRQGSPRRAAGDGADYLSSVTDHLKGVGQVLISRGWPPAPWPSLASRNRELAIEQNSPWNWVGTVITVALVLAAIPRTKARGYLPVFAASAAVAAALAWSGVGGSWHFVVFPVLPLLLLVAVRFGSRVDVHETDAITVPFGRPREIYARPRRAEPQDTTAVWSPVTWAPAAVTAIILLASGVAEAWLIALLFPVVPLVEIVVLWKRSPIAPAGWWLALVAAPAIALIAAVVAAPDAPVSAATATTTSTAAAISTTTPVVEAIFIDVQGSVAQPDGTLSVVPVEGAFISFTGEGTARFALTDVFGRATFFVEPGAYTVFIEPPGNRWSIVDGCSDRLEAFPVATAEEWTWVVRMVDTNSVTAYGATPPHCDEVIAPTPGKGF